MKPLIIVRPEPGAAATAARAARRGLKAQCHSLFAVAPVAWPVPDPRAYAGLLLTSANAVRHGGDGLRLLRDLPVYAVGEATAAAARAAGLTVIHTGTGDAARLLAQATRPGDAPLLHLCGEDVTQLADAPIRIERRIVYAARAIPPSPALRAVIEVPAVVMLHSARAARALAAIVAERRHIALATISAEVAAAAGTGWHAIDVASAPRDDDVLDVAARLATE